VKPKPADESLTFGDVIEADWLFDVYLRESSERLTAKVDGGGNVTGYVSRKTPYKGKGKAKDYAVAFATNGDAIADGEGDPSEIGHTLSFGDKRRAIVLTDECETDKVIAKGGRLMVASLMTWPTVPKEIDALLAEDGSSWRRFPLPPEPGWDGAVVDFSRHAAVWHEAVPHADILFSLDPKRSALLKVAWAAYATRHGPLAVADGVKKIIEMIHIADDTAKWEIDRKHLPLTADETDALAKIKKALRIAWLIEGPLIDDISLAHERRQRGTDQVELLLEQLDDLRVAAAEAEAALRLIASR
jgi:hypothetical protein